MTIHTHGHSHAWPFTPQAHLRRTHEGLPESKDGVQGAGVQGAGVQGAGGSRGAVPAGGGGSRVQAGGGLLVRWEMANAALVQAGGRAMSHAEMVGARLFTGPCFVKYDAATKALARGGSVTSAEGVKSAV